MTSMKIAISSEHPGGLDAKVAEHFGRCPMFTIVEVENKEIKRSYSIPNPGANASGGAGPAAVQAIVKENASIVLIPQLGPKAKQALEAAGMEIHSYQKGLTVKEAVQNYLSN